MSHFYDIDDKENNMAKQLLAGMTDKLVNKTDEELLRELAKPKKKDDQKVTRMNIFLPDELHSKLKIQAAKNKQTMNVIIIEALESHLKETEV
jgi:predicted HicB family RNase H-like nuclease